MIQGKKWVACVLQFWAAQMIKYIINSPTWFTLHTTWAALVLLLCVTLWTSHVTSNTERTQRPMHLLPKLLLLSLIYSPFPTSLPPLLFFPLFMPLLPSLCVCACVCMLREQRLIAWGKSSTLLGWPSSGRVIHPYPFPSPNPLHSALFLFHPPTTP